MKRAKIYIDGLFCGILTEDPEGYHFKYDSQYLSMPDAKALSPTMPLQEEEYEKEMMFPVFDGLIPEGWLLNIVTENWKIEPKDRFGLLLVACKDPIGNVRIKEVRE